MKSADAISKSTKKGLNAALPTLCTAVIEVVIPLLIILLPVAILASLMQPGMSSKKAVITFYFLFIPAIAAVVQRFTISKKKKLDLYLLAVLELLAFSFILWIPSIIVGTGFCLLFYILIKIKAPRSSFTALFLIASLLALLSETLPIGHEKLRSFFAPLIVLTIIPSAVLILYSLIVGKEKFFTRPRIALSLGMIYLFCSAIFAYISGGRTGWLTWAIVKQQGVEMLLPAHPKITGPRAVVPVKDGLLIYTNNDKFIKSNDKSLDKFSPDIKIGRVDLPICDPDDKSICYFAARKIGIVVLNTSNWQMEQVNLQPFDYDLIAADSKMRYLAVREDNGRHLAIVKRVAPGKLEKVCVLDSFALIPNGHASFLEFIDQKLVIVIQAKNRIACFTYDVLTGEQNKFMDVATSLRGDVSYHGAVVGKKLIVLPMTSGRIFVLDVKGKKVSKSFLFPILRQVIYDPQRKLCYIVSDLGFLFIYDPWKAKNIKTLFLGLKTKNVHHEGDYLYIGSSAGIFRVDIDKTL